MKRHALLNILVVIGLVATSYVAITMGDHRSSYWAGMYLFHYAFASLATWTMAPLRRMRWKNEAGQTFQVGQALLALLYVLFWSVLINLFFGLYALFGTQAHLSDLQSFIAFIVTVHAGGIAGWRLNRSLPYARALKAFAGRINSSSR